jgi:hypothetical protein
MATRPGWREGGQVAGLAGRVPMRMQLVVRFEYGSTVPWVSHRGHVLSAVAGPDALALRSPIQTRGEDLTTVAEFAVGAGEPGAVRAHLARLVRAGAACDRCSPRRRGDRDVVARVVESVRVRGRVPRRRRAFPHRAEGPHVRADRRHRRRGDDVPPGAAGMSAELGLPATAGCATRRSRSTRS